jgi:hypothetical protein
MAHKSRGYIYTTDAVPSLIRNGSLTFFNRLEHHSEQAATLVMHEASTHERVFTESEVKAMMEDVAHCITWPEAKRVLKSKHGLLLDLA